MNEKIKIINKYSGETIEEITGHLNFDYYMQDARETIREKTFEDLEFEGIETTEENVEDAMAEGYEIEIEEE